MKTSSRTIRTYRVNINKSVNEEFKRLMDQFKEVDGIDRYRDVIRDDWYANLIRDMKEFTTKICIYEDELLMLKLALGGDFKSRVCERKYNAYSLTRHKKPIFRDPPLLGYSMQYPTMTRVFMTNKGRARSKSAR